MLENKKITKEEYDKALQENIVANIKPGIKNVDNLSNYYSDIIYEQVIAKLIEKDTRNKKLKANL